MRCEVLRAAELSALCGLQALGLTTQTTLRSTWISRERR